MIAVKVGEGGKVEPAARPFGMHATDVVRDPLAGAPRGVRTRRRVIAGLAAAGPVHGAGVEQERRAVGQDKQGGVARARIDLVNIQPAALPGGQGAARLGTFGGSNAEDRHRQAKEKTRRTAAPGWSCVGRALPCAPQSGANPVSNQ